MAQSKSLADLIAQVLSNLGVLAAGQSLAPEDYDRVNNLVDPCLAYLAGEKIIYIPNSNAIPATVFPLVADVLANFCKQSFGKAGDDRLLRDANEAERKLKRMAGRNFVPGELRVDTALQNRARAGTYDGN